MDSWWPMVQNDVWGWWFDVCKDESIAGCIPLVFRWASQGPKQVLHSPSQLHCLQGKRSVMKVQGQISKARNRSVPGGKIITTIPPLIIRPLLSIFFHFPYRVSSRWCALWSYVEITCFMACQHLGFCQCSRRLRKKKGHMVVGGEELRWLWIIM